MILKQTGQKCQEHVYKYQRIQEEMN